MTVNDSLNQKSLVRLCKDLNAGKSVRWHRIFCIAYKRCKAGLPSNYPSFTLRDKIYTWTGI